MKLVSDPKKWLELAPRSDPAPNFANCRLGKPGQTEHTYANRRLSTSFGNFQFGEKALFLKHGASSCNINGAIKNATPIRRY